MAPATREFDSSERVGRFAVFAGAMGLVAGILYSGPHFREWTIVPLFLVPVATGLVAAIVGAVAGYFASRHPNSMSNPDGPGNPAGGDHGSED